ncbi:sulfatase family protein [Prosthecobacter vanneervenii]|uniref:Putative sulfatase n=1 Tax=Prosthecobacter vanneervenii TaxID=48466 RepID=A0A7W7YAC8_9BACT|nr:sulfatase [Prosthecobacter vanneervenii]MBB5032546.1 putative sulfatase [Prosthecobacter vanneervenii]
MKTSLLTLLSIFVVLLASLPAKQPNIVVILADDLGYGDLGCYGHPKIKTPNLDRMAAEGARFTQFNCPAPFCAPTRSALMTGRYPFRCGMTANPAPDGGPEADALHLPEKETTLAQVLKSAGYATGMVGKWHLGHKPGFLPTERGFDEYYGIPYSNDMRPVQVLEGTQIIEYPVVQATLTRRYTERALGFIERSKGQPFLLYLAEAMPHKPLAVSEAFYKKSEAGLYGDAVEELDWSVGQVLAKLKELGLDENTLVLFTSDNGAWFGGSCGVLRGMKSAQWEGGYRVPMIARWPGQIPAGRMCDQLAITMDLFATVLEATGAMMPDDRVLDGRSLMPVLKSAEAKSPHEYIFGHLNSKLANIRDARWKLHVLPATQIKLKPGADGKWLDPRAPDGVTILAPYEQYNLDAFPGLNTGDAAAKMQLFDLQHDPGEQHDVATEHPEEVKRLMAAYEEMNKDVPVILEVKRTPYKK